MAFTKLTLNTSPASTLVTLNTSPSWTGVALPATTHWIAPGSDTRSWNVLTVNC